MAVNDNIKEVSFQMFRAANYFLITKLEWQNALHFSDWYKKRLCSYFITSFIIYG